MPLLGYVEKQIMEIEGIKIAFKQNGKDIRSDKQGFPSYPYKRKAKGDMTVKEFINTRLKPNYVGCDFLIYDQDDNEVYGNTKLSSIR